MRRSIKIILLIVFLVSNYLTYGWIFNEQELSLQVEMIEGEAQAA